MANTPERESLAHRIRRFAFENYVTPMRGTPDTEIRIRAGDVHKAMGLSARMPAVCGALDSIIFQREFGLELVRRDGPPLGANVEFGFRIAEVRSVRAQPNPAELPAQPMTPGTERPEQPLQAGGSGGQSETRRPSPPASGSNAASEALSTATQSPVPKKGTRSDPVQENAIVLLSCVKSKRDYRCRAGDMYTSTLFKKGMAYAQSVKPKSIFILSAKYGLLSPDDIIDPYEKTLKNMQADERQQWAQDVIMELRKRCDLNKDQFVFLAGTPYRENLVRHLTHYEVPMEGLSFGQQLQWLSCQLQ